MTIRGASVVVAIVLTVAVAVPARAQGPNQPPANSLAAQVAELQARVAKLEGNIVASDLAGTYSLIGIDNSLTALHAGQPPTNATITMSAFRTTLTLNADGTGKTSNFSGESSTLTQGSWAVTGVNDQSQPGPDVTWKYADGVITITFLDDGDEIPFTVALGGRFFMLGYAPFHAGDPSGQQLLIFATRLR
jgi:hypothetical protein